MIRSKQAPDAFSFSAVGRNGAAPVTPVKPFLPIWFAPIAQRIEVPSIAAARKRLRRAAGSMRGASSQAKQRGATA